MPALSKDKLTIISIFISMIALLLVGLVVWVHLSTQEQVQQLQHKLENMQNILERADSLQPELTQMREHIQHIEEKLISMENQSKTTIKPVTATKTIKIITPQTPVHPIAQKIVPQTKKKLAPISYWMVVIASFDTLEKAKHAQQRKRISTLHSSITMVKIKHRTWYRIVRPGFKDKASAVDYSQKIKRLGFHDAWIQHYP